MYMKREDAAGLRGAKGRDNRRFQGRTRSGQNVICDGFKTLQIYRTGRFVSAYKGRGGVGKLCIVTLSLVK